MPLFLLPATRGQATSDFIRAIVRTDVPATSRHGTSLDTMSSDHTSRDVRAIVGATSFDWRGDVRRPARMFAWRTWWRLEESPCRNQGCRTVSARVTSNSLLGTRLSYARLKSGCPRRWIRTRCPTGWSAPCRGGETRRLLCCAFRPFEAACLGRGAGARAIFGGWKRFFCLGRMTSRPEGRAMRIRRPKSAPAAPLGNE